MLTIRLELTTKPQNRAEKGLKCLKIGLEVLKCLRTGLLKGRRRKNRAKSPRRPENKNKKLAKRA